MALGMLSIYFLMRICVRRVNIYIYVSKARNQPRREYIRLESSNHSKQSAFRKAVVLHRILVSSNSFSCQNRHSAKIRGSWQLLDLWLWIEFRFGRMRIDAELLHSLVSCFG